MANEVSISRSKPISKFRKGAVFAIKTTTGDYAIDYATAQKLSELVVANNELRFVKVNTEQGLVVLNTASIMAITVDDEDAKKNLSLIRGWRRDFPDMTPDEMFTKLNSSNIFNGRKSLKRDIFDYLYAAAQKEVD